MAVDDNWGEAIRKSTEQVTPGDKAEYLFKTRVVAAAPTPVGPVTAVALPVSVVVGSTTLFAANPAAVGRTVYNDGGGNIYVKFGTGASSSSFTVRVSDNGYYELPQPLYKGIVTASAASGTRTTRVTEW